MAVGASRGSDGQASARSDRLTTRLKRRLRSQSTVAWAFVAPAAVAMLLVALVPVLYAAGMSLFTYNEYTRQGFSGLQNYSQALADEQFWPAIQMTFTFTCVSVTLEFLIGLGFALIMAHTFFGRSLTRVVILVPWVIPSVIAAQMWYFMFNIQPGFITSVLTFMPRDFNWLGQPGWTLFAVIVADVWKTAPFMALLLLAGLQSIPRELYEAARVDGATAWPRFFHVTLPLLRPTIFVALMFRTVDALRVYDLPKVMTNGTFGTQSLSMLVEQYLVVTIDPGIGAALAVLTFAIVLGVGVVFVLLLARNLGFGAQGGQ